MPVTSTQTEQVPSGINLRKEAQKIDLKQFSSSNVEHVEPIISVMRPHAAQENTGGLQDNGNQRTDMSNRKGRLVDQEKEMHIERKRMTRAWKRLRPD